MNRAPRRIRHWNEECDIHAQNYIGKNNTKRCDLCLYILCKPFENLCQKVLLELTLIWEGYQNNPEFLLTANRLYTYRKYIQ